MPRNGRPRGSAAYPSGEKCSAQAAIRTNGLVGVGDWVGAWAIGSAWGPVKDGDSLEALRASLDDGVDFLDTADVYGEDHKSERLIAGILKERRKQGKAFQKSRLRLAGGCRSRTRGSSPMRISRPSSRTASRRSRLTQSISCNCTARRSKRTTVLKFLRRWTAFSVKARFASTA